MITAGAAAVLFSALTAVVVAFHLCLILGAPWGHLTMGGRWPGVLTIRQRMVSGMSILALAGLALVVAGQGDLIATPFAPWAMWLVLAYLALAIAMHLATPSRAERRLWLPIILAMMLAALGVHFA